MVAVGFLTNFLACTLFDKSFTVFGILYLAGSDRWIWIWLILNDQVKPQAPIDEGSDSRLTCSNEDSPCNGLLFCKSRSHKCLGFKFFWDLIRMCSFSSESGPSQVCLAADFDAQGLANCAAAFALLSTEVPGLRSMLSQRSRASRR